MDEMTAPDTARDTARAADGAAADSHAAHGPAGGATSGHAFAGVPIEVTVAVGKARPALRDLLRLGPNAVLPLDSRVEDPVELYVGDRLIARGELQELDGEQAGQLAVRLTEVIDSRPAP